MNRHRPSPVSQRDSSVARNRLRFAAIAAVLAACGSRTGLLADTSPPEPDFPVYDAAADVPDVVDAAKDALPTIEASVNADVDRRDCPDPSATFIYLISSDDELYSYYPPDGTFKAVGSVQCPTATPNQHPFSMAVDRQGVAYTVFTDGHLYRVSTKTAACADTGFVPNQSNFGQFGMGFASENGGPLETLFVAGDEAFGSAGLGRIDTSTFRLTPIAAFVPDLSRAEFTGTGDGRLFGFYEKPGDTGTYVGEIDKRNARVLAETPLPKVALGNAWAFGVWGGDFYTFTSADVISTIHRYRPADGSIVDLGTAPIRVVGAGVSTCAPDR
jgi:hypothetical protein